MGTFCKQWTLTLGAAVERSTTHTYTSAATSYITFCNLHNFPTEPTVEQLCFYIIYMLHHIKPSSMKSYLSGICAELKPFYPDIHSIWSSKLINQTLAGCTKLYGSPAKRKCALTKSNLLTIIQATPHCASHNDLLFNAIVLVGWHCLLRLGKLVDHNTANLQDYCKSISQLSVKFHSTVMIGSPRDKEGQTWAQPLGWPLSHQVCMISHNGWTGVSQLIF